MSDLYRCYIVKCKDDTLYCGIAKRVRKRVEQHNKNIGAKYTKGRGPVTLVYVSILLPHDQALGFERIIKKKSRADKLLMINACKHYLTVFSDSL